MRRGEDDHLFVLVPGDRSISWPKLRAVLGVSRMSMPDAVTATATVALDADAALAVLDATVADVSDPE